MTPLKPQPRANRPAGRGHCIHRLAGAVIVSCGVLGSLAAGQIPPQAETLQRTEAQEEALEAFLSPETPAEQLPGLAEAIVRTGSPTALGALADLLSQPLRNGAPERARAVLNAVTVVAPPPHALHGPVVALAKDAASPLSVEAVRALRGYRTRETAAILVEILTRSENGDRRRTAARSLAALSGREDVPIDAWPAWLAGVVALPESQWQQQLVAAHVRRAQSYRAEADEAHRGLAEAWRRIHLLTPQEERSAVLTQLLQSPTPTLRSLGFDLVNREIGESRQFDGSVAGAAIGLLSHGDPSVRAQAASLLGRLAPTDAEAPVLAALQREADPQAADALLLASSRWPTPAAVAPTLRWLQVPETRIRAIGAAWALHRAGALTEPADVETVLAVVRELPDASLSGPACRLLAALGGPEDVERLRRLLGAEATPLRVAAADALAMRADEVDSLLAAATGDPTLFEACARALQTHLHDARGYDALRRLPSPSPQVRSRVLADYATLLPTHEIIRLARLAPDRGEAMSLLQPLLATDRARDAEAVPQLVEGLLLLANLHIESGNPAEALAALAAVPLSADLPVAAAAVELRTAVLLWLNRIDEAEQVDSSPEAWLRGLELAIGEPFAAEIAEAITERFVDLSDEQRARLDALEHQLASTDPETEGG